MDEQHAPTAPTDPGNSFEPVELVHGERPIPDAARLLRSQVLPAAVTPVGSIAAPVALVAAGVLTRGSGKSGLFLLPFFLVGLLLQLWARPRRPGIARYQDGMDAAIIRRGALRRGTVPREESRAKSAGVRSCEDLELACLLAGTLVAVVAQLFLWGAGDLWPTLVILGVMCVVYGVRAPRAWRYLALLHDR